MGSKPAPSYANIYIANKIDPEVEKLGFKYGQNGSSSIILFKVFHSRTNSQRKLELEFQFHEKIIFFVKLHLERWNFNFTEIKIS